MERRLVSVDRWADGSQAYFLTHLHADHTPASWARGPLYCSPLTARLLPTRFPGIDVSLLRPIPAGEAHVLALASPATATPVRLRVTPIDAYHCPGAVMYLFQGEFGCVLYTGDFRWEPSERAQLGMTLLLDALNGDKVDVLYLDNTYCHPSFSFPSREVAAEQAVDIIKLHPDHEIIIGLDTLGKEDMLIHISQALSTKIWVWPERLQTMHLLGYDDSFTTRTCFTRIRAVPRYSLTFNTLEALNTVHPTIGIMPSGLPWGVKPFNKDSSLGSPLRMSGKSNDSTKVRLQLDKNQIYSKFNHFAYSVPYSEHSCYNELEEFMRIVQPSNVIGIVASSFCYINPQFYFGHLCGANQSSNMPNDNLSDRKAEKIEVQQSKFVLAYRKSAKLRAKKEWTSKISSSRAHKSRMRKRLGAKIV